MRNRILLVVAVASTTLLVALSTFVLWAYHRLEPAPDIVSSIDPNCHPQTSYDTGRVSGDGWQGWYHTCVQRHGPFYVWRDGKLVQRGQYVNGKKDGLFTFYALDGSVIKETRYANGEETK